MIGCGGEITMLQGEDAVLATGVDEIFKSIFGEAVKEESDRYGPLEFTCTEGHWNKRPRGKLIKKCRFKHCKEGSVGC
jgi:hypothetical protein